MQVRSAHNGNSWLRSQRPVLPSAVLALSFGRHLLRTGASFRSLAESLSFPRLLCPSVYPSSAVCVDAAVTRCRRGSFARPLTSGIRDYRSSYAGILARGTRRTTRHRRERKSLASAALRSPDFRRAPLFARPADAEHDSAHFQPSGFLSTVFSLAPGPAGDKIRVDENSTR